MDPINIATNVNPRFDHVGKIESAQTDVTITHRCESLGELLAVGRSGLIDLILVADDVENLGPGFIDRLEESNPCQVVVGVISDQHAHRQRLTDAGIAAISPDVSQDELLEWIRSIHRGEKANEPPAVPDETTTADRLRALQAEEEGPLFSAADLQFLAQLPSGTQSSEIETEPDEYSFSSEDAETQSDVPEQESFAQEPGKISVVWGPIGSPGRSTVAMNLAAESALAGYQTLLIDADTYGASQATAWGLLEDSAGIAQACRSAESQEVKLSDIQGHCSVVSVEDSTLWLLTGLTRADRWPEVRKSSWERVLEVAKQGWEHIVIDVGFGLEEDEELSFDIPAPQRNATTLAAVETADTIFAVGAPDPINMARYIRSLEELEAATAGARVVHVMNKVSSAATGPGPQRQIRHVWDRFGRGDEPQHFLPSDHQAVATALLSAQPLAESNPNSDLRTGIQKLLAECELGTAGTGEFSDQQAKNSQDKAKTKWWRPRFPQALRKTTSKDAADTQADQHHSEPVRSTVSAGLTASLEDPEASAQPQSRREARQMRQRSKSR